MIRNVESISTADLVDASQKTNADPCPFGILCHFGNLTVAEQFKLFKVLIEFSQKELPTEKGLIVSFVDKKV